MKRAKVVIGNWRWIAIKRPENESDKERRNSVSLRSELEAISGREVKLVKALKLLPTANQQIARAAVTLDRMHS